MGHEWYVVVNSRSPKSKSDGCGLDVLKVSDIIDALSQGQQRGHKWRRRRESEDSVV